MSKKRLCIAVPILILILDADLGGWSVPHVPEILPHTECIEKKCEHCFKGDNFTQVKVLNKVCAHMKA